MKITSIDKNKKRSESENIPFERNSLKSDTSHEKAEEYAKQTKAHLQKNIEQGVILGNYLHKIKGNTKRPIKNKSLHLHKATLNINMKIEGEQQLKKYKLLGELGKGAHASVQMAIDNTTNSKVAIKIYEKKALGQTNRQINLEREINILNKLNHPNIAKISKIIETKEQLFLVMEYGGANSLFNYLISKQEHRLPPDEINYFMLTIANTIEYLHSKNIVHRDIKAENILINRYKQIKLIDFGFSIHSEPGEYIDTFCGTPVYMAPEIVARVNHIPIYTDMWSLGILLFVMSQGNYPFRSKNEQQLFGRIYSGAFSYIREDAQKHHRFLIENLLVKDPRKRLTIE